jgi:methylmalonyl-CoA mutase
LIPDQVIRSTTVEKDQQIINLQAFQKRNKPETEMQLAKLKQVAIENGNLFEALMEAVKYCSLGQITDALYEVGGQYRRNM